MFGKFITLEGVDGSGKSIQAKNISNYLKSISINNILIREPGGTNFGEKLREVILFNKDISPLSETLLFFAARNELLKTVIFPTLEKGIWVICDRFYDSTLVYQGILGNVDIENIMQIKDMVMQDFEPDLTIILQLNAKTAIKRVHERNSTLNKFDNLDITHYEKMINAYTKIFYTFPFRCNIINSNKTENHVFEEIKNLLHKKFNIPNTKTN